MKIHEYQSKELLRKFGVAVPSGELALNAKEAAAAAEKIGFPVVIKAQIHAGGRGKGGGIRLVRTAEELKTATPGILGMTLVTPQTGPEGKLVRKVWIEKATDIAREFYLGLVLDRARSRLVMMASSEGGVEIEEVAARSPEKIFKEWIDPATGLQPFQARKLGFRLGLDNNTVKKFAFFAMNLYRFFTAADAAMAEINPLVLTKEGDVAALDAKIHFDDNALFRHPDLAELMDADEEDSAELEAKSHNLNYISLDGNIGCLVNGAGLAMATMDIIKLCGGEPCNFLDVGGSASQDAVAQAFKIILRNGKVRAIFINIFGGILKCDLLAQGIVNAAREVGVAVPIVARLLGTHVEEGKKIIASSDLNIIGEDDMTKAAQEVVRLAGGDGFAPSGLAMTI